MEVRKGSSRKKSRAGLGICRWALYLMMISLFAKSVFSFIYNSKVSKENEDKYVFLDPKEDRKIQWDDTVLEDKVRQWIDKREGDIYLRDLWDITALKLDRWVGDDGIVGDEIRDISSLEGLQNLRILSLEYHDVADIHVISSMTNLEKLDLNGNHIQDLSAIVSLQFLKKLDLRNTCIQKEELKCISELKSLSTLRLDYNGLEELGVVEELNLFCLTASGNEITDISPLRNSDKCRFIDLCSNRITDISPLKNVDKCLALDLSDNEITDVGALSALKRLEYLNLCDNKITDITPLKSLRNVYLLSLCDNQITTLPDLSGMTSLLYLHLEDNQITTEEWKKVRLPWSICTVYITGNPITDLETDREYPGLEVIFEEEMIEDR